MQLKNLKILYFLRFYSHISNYVELYERPNYVKAIAQDEELNEFEIEGEELLARALIHEIEHLDGHLFVEKVEGPLMDVEIAEEDA